MRVPTVCGIELPLYEQLFRPERPLGFALHLEPEE